MVVHLGDVQMLPRYALFVDAGYLVAQGAKLLAGEANAPGRVRLEHPALVPFFRAWGDRICGEDSEMLRIYWYDASQGGGPNPAQVSMAVQPGLKLRLGTLNMRGQQKGVDTLLVHDLTTLARNRAIADAVVVSGDDDLRLGVVLAQELGVRVHLMGVAPSGRNTSLGLRMEADGLYELQSQDLGEFMRFEPYPDLMPGEASHFPQDHHAQGDGFGAEEVDLGPGFAVPTPPTSAAGMLPSPAAAPYAPTPPQAPLSAAASGFDWERLRHVPRPTFEDLAVLPHPAPMEQVAELVFAAMPPELQEALRGWPHSRPLPQVVDGALMVTGGEVAGSRLEADAKQALRRAFRTMLHTAGAS